MADTKRLHYFRNPFVLLFISSTLLAGSALGQGAVRIDPATGGHLGWLTHPYQPRTVPAINLSNSPRFDSLIRGGNLYLSAQDVVALAIENSLDIEVQRYGPLLEREVLRRAQGGGALRSVGLAVAPGPPSVSLQGVSVNAAGGAGTGGVSSGGGIVTQLGIPAIQSLDPSVLVFANFPARDKSAKQYVPDRDNGVDSGYEYLSSRLLPRTSCLASTLN